MQNDAVLGTVGFDDLIADHVTVAADLVSELQVGHSKLALPAPVEYDYPFKRTIVPTSVPKAFMPARPAPKIRRKR